MSEQTARKPLNVEDVATLMAIKSQADNYRSAIDALEGMHNTLLENMRVRYNAPVEDGWQLNDYIAGFVLLPDQEHVHVHDHQH